jgi:molybdenum-dependent DNA-binding transcriptional regulator ModE
MPETPEPQAPGKPPAVAVAWTKAHQYADKLFDSLEALEEAGGIVQAARLAGWSPKARKRAEASIVAARDALDRQLKALRGGGR